MKELIGVFDVGSMNDEDLDKFSEVIDKSIKNQNTKKEPEQNSELVQYLRKTGQIND